MGEALAGHRAVCPGRISFPGVKHTSGDQAYRDYVVRAFNTDKPYNQFVVEQLAGDLLPAAQDQQKQFDQIIAPAFLSIGSWFDQCTDPNRLRMEIIDDMIGTTAQGFLGLSAQCARCHDHKFDPIPTADYYAMAGVFGSTRVLDQLNNYWRDGRPRLLKPLSMPDEVAASASLAQRVAQLRQSKWELLTDGAVPACLRIQGPRGGLLNRGGRGAPLVSPYIQGRGV